jgi:hypothetical protein
MARFVEPVILNGINKDVAPNGLDNSNRKVLNPLRDALNIRYLSSEGGDEFQAENIKGTEIVPLPLVYKQLVVNPGFSGSLDGWTVFTIPDSGLVWTYSSGDQRAQIVRVGAGAGFSVILGQSVNVEAGTMIDSNFIAGITSGVVTSLTAVGYFLDADDNILETFNIGSFSTIVFGEASKNIFFSKLVPAGAKKFGVAITVVAPGSFTFKVDTFLTRGYQFIGNPDGINECIGTYENIERNLLIYFLWNSNGYHGVYKYDSATNTIYQLLIDDPSNPVLNFSNNPRYTVTGVGMIGDILSWTDNLNPQRYINITKEYTTINDFIISLIKIGPRNKPTFTDKTTISPNTDLNKLAANSIQVAHRYVYLDNEVSVLSPYSDLIIAEAYGEDRVFLNFRNKIDITFPIDTDISPVIQRVELLYRINNEASWKIFKKYEIFGSSIIESFTNTSIGESVPDIETSKIFDSIPNRSKALVIARNRVFLNINEEGMEVPDITITPSLGPDRNTRLVASFGSGAWTKKNGQYSVGIVASDKFGRFTAVYQKAKLNGRQYVMGSTDGQFTPSTSVDPDNLNGNRINVALTGQVPENSRYSIVITPELQYEQYLQTWSLPVIYLRDVTTKNPTKPNTDEREYNGRVYLIRQNNSGNTPSNTPIAYFHWALPENIPFVPDTSYSVRILTNGNVYITERVLAVLDGNILVTGIFKLDNFNLFASFIEVFKLKESKDIFYYEVAGPFESSGNTPLITSIQELQADTYYRGAYLQGLDVTSNVDANIRSTKFNSGIIIVRVGSNVITKPTQHETPSPVYISGGIDKTSIKIDDPHVQTTSGRIKDYSFDYSKSAWSRGRSFVEATPGILFRPATIRFSDVYVENSKINGLNSFPVENIYDKIGQDRSPITKFVAVGNILLAIHERHITTIYIGEGIVRTGDTGFLTKVNDVVGDDRKLIGAHGSYHPESVQEIDGQAFGFDIFNGSIWRYTVEGIFAISDYGMKSFFRDKANAYFGAKDQLKFVSSIDRYHKEYLITLPHLYAEWRVMSLQTAEASSQSIDFPLAAEDYELNKTYRMRINPWSQTGISTDTITIAVLANGTDIIKSNIIHTAPKLNSETTPVYVEFVYTGQAFNRINISSVNEPLYISISSEYQRITGETWAFNYEKKVWAQRYSFVPEFMGRIGNGFYSFKDGRLYKHNASEVYNNFYGVQYESSVRVVCNPQPNKVKVWSALQIAAISLCADESSSFKVMECENDQEQASYTRAKEFKKREGVYYAPILRDVNTNPLLLSAGKIALRDGKDMRSKSLEITIHNDRTDRCLLQKLNIIGEFSEFSI